MDILNLLKEWWQFVSAVSIGLAGAVGWYLNWKSNQKKSTAQLYDQLEQLKKKVILQVQQDVARATELAEKDKLIAELKINCPDCYKQIYERYNTKSDG